MLNAALLGLGESCPVATPLPESDKLVNASEASLLTATVALNAPVAFGANCTLKLTLCPAAITTGKVGEVSEKYFVDTAALLIVTGTLPKFVAATLKVLLLPAATLPKSRV